MRSSVRMMPESADSTGYGTRIRSGSDSPTGGSSPAVAPANSQTPLRFFHSGRVSCGRGYSGCALFGPTSWVHGVERGGVFGCHTGSAVAGIAGTKAATSKAATAKTLRDMDHLSHRDARLRYACTATTTARKAPLTTDWKCVLKVPIWLITFWMTRSSKTPASVPLTEPAPPVSSVPPMTTAAIASSSRPSPTMVTPEAEYAAASAPASPAVRPLITYTSIV